MRALSEWPLVVPLRCGQLLGFVFRWLHRVGGLDDELLVERDYCHDMAHFTRTAEEIMAANDGANPFCMAELSSFLGATMAITAGFTVVGILFSHLRHHSRNFGLRAYFYERQARLQPFDGVTDSCLQLVIEVGYVVLFAPAFPLAAIIIWLVNLFQQRADAYKLLKLTRRPLPRKVSQLFGMHEMLMAIGLIGLITNIGLLFFTATQVSGLLQELPRLPIPLFASLSVSPSWDHFAAFVATEHVLLLLYWVITTCVPDDSPKIARLRAWSEHFEPLWRAKVLALPKRQPDKQSFNKLGPFKLAPVPEVVWLNPEIVKDERRRPAPPPASSAVAAMRALSNHKPFPNHTKFEMDGSQWSIDPHCSWLLGELLHERSDPSAYGTDKQENAPPARAHGRVSPKRIVTLSPQAKKELGVPEEAVRFAFAYPLSRFANYDTSDAELPLDLELELHVAVAMGHRDDALDHSAEPDDERARVLALQFLAVGGFVYFNLDNVIVQLATVVPQTEVNKQHGLFFSDPIVSAHPDNTTSSKHAEFYAQQIGKRLKERRDFCNPTLPFLKARGVVGFCWLSPSEIVPGMRSVRKDGQSKDSIEIEKMLEEVQKEEEQAKSIAGDMWSDGAFVYMFEEEEDLHKYFGPESEFDPDKVQGRFYMFSVMMDPVRRAATRLQRQWRWRKALLILDAWIKLKTQMTAQQKEAGRSSESMDHLLKQQEQVVAASLRSASKSVAN